MSLATYIKLIQKAVHPELSFTGNSLQTLELLVGIVLLKFYTTVNLLLQNEDCKTVKDRHISFAVISVLPGAIAKYARGDIAMALTEYATNKAGHDADKSQEKKPMSKHDLAGLKMSVSRIDTGLRANVLADRISDKASIALAAAIEYLVAEIVELAGNSTRDDKRVRITTRDIKLVIGSDEELSDLFRGAVIGGGVNVD